MRTAKFLLSLGLLALGLAPAARADLILDTTPAWDGSSYVVPFGKPDTATYGQTVTVLAEAPRLDSFTFYIDGPAEQVFRGYVYAWDGSKLTGPALYTSPDRTLAGTPGFEAITFETGGLELTPGSRYALFASVSEVYARTQGTSHWGYIRDRNTYPGGNFIYDNNGGDFGRLSSSTWDATDASEFWGDLAFQARFSAVPEPATVVSASLAGLIVVGRRTLRRRGNRV